MQSPNEGYRLSVIQKYFWEEEDSSEMYVRITCDGSLDLPCLEFALTEVVQRHQILRTQILTHSGFHQPVQVIADQDPTVLCFDGDGNWPDQAQPNAGSGGLQAQLVELQPEKHLLILKCPVLCADMETLFLCFEEMATIYASRCGAQDPELDAPTQFLQFSEWQYDTLAGEDGEEGAAWWRQAGVVPHYGLPFGLAGACDRSFCESLELPFQKSLEESVTLLAEHGETDVDRVLLTCWFMLLSQHLEARHLTLGVAMNCRIYEELETCFGPLGHVLPVSLAREKGLTFRDLLALVDGALETADSWQEHFDPGVPDTLDLAFEYLQKPQARRLDDLELSIIDYHEGGNRHVLRLSVIHGEDLRMKLIYDGTHLRESDAKALGDQLISLIHTAATNPDSEIQPSDWVSEAERQRVLTALNRTEEPTSTHLCLHQLIEQQAEVSPDAIAVVFEDGSTALTYKDLNQSANQLAFYLREKGVGPQVPVGICLGHSPDLLVGLLGVMKAGAAFVPLDGTSPPDRLLHILQDAHIPLVITDEAGISALPQNGKKTLLLAGGWHQIADQPKHNLELVTTPEDLAYIIYTSGSTGQPKGTLLVHRGVVNYLSWAVNAYQVKPGGHVPLHGSIGFDATITSLFAPLMAGGVIHLLDHMNPIQSICALLRRDINCSFLKLTPSHLKAILQLIPSKEVIRAQVNYLILGGEALGWEETSQWNALMPDCRVVNEYGPTEAHVGCCVHTVTELQDHGAVPIGKPIANTQLYVLNDQLRPLPVGIPGELYIGGICLAKGYLGRESLTQERFIDHPFCEKPGAKLYKTGDRVRYLTDGSLMYLGRIDRQLKLRGYRIEPGEIEMVVKMLPDVQDAVVAAQASESGDVRLVCWLIGGSGADEASLRQALLERLPDYMIPAAVVWMKHFPLTGNGKVDFEALPDPKEVVSKQVFVAPRNPVEEIVAGIWSALLNLERVGVHENFFELGGHSLLATQVISRIRKSLDVELHLDALFQAPTIAELTVLVETSDSMRNLPAISAEVRPDTLPLSFAQSRLWFLRQFEGPSATYNLSMALKMIGQLDVKALVRAFEWVHARHEILRTIFADEGGTPHQVIQPASRPHLPVTDLSHLPASRCEAARLRLQAKESGYCFDLAKGPLVRYHLLRLGDEEHVLLMTLHHIISDGWSQSLFIKEVSTAYRAFLCDEPLALPELPVQYADYAMWQHAWLDGPQLEEKLAYWVQKLSGASPVMDIPLDHPRPDAMRFRGDMEVFALEKEHLQALKAIGGDAGATLFMTLFAAFNLLLSRYTNSEDVVIGTDIAGRDRREIEGLIGFFVNQLALRTDLSGRPDFLALLARVRKTCLEAYTHSEVPFERIVEAVSPGRDLSTTPVFQVNFVFENTPKSRLKMPLLEFENLEQERDVARFDLTLWSTEIDGQLQGGLEYNRDVFEKDTIRRMLGHYLHLLKAIAADPGKSIDAYPLMTDEVQDDLITAWMGPSFAKPLQSCFHHLFEGWAERRPDGLALQWVEAEGPAAGTQLTYAALNAQANRVAHQLLAQGVGSGQVVGAEFEKSPEWIAAFLGILKAGAIYLPIDPELPAERKAFMLEDTDAKLLLVSEGFEDEPTVVPRKTVCLKTPVPPDLGENPSVPVGPEDTAYIIYTSGSTGKPKGAVLGHRGYSHFSEGLRQRHGLQPQDRVLQFSTLSFDVSLMDIALAFGAGGTLCLNPKKALLPGPDLAKVLRDQKITVAAMVPSVWNVLPVIPLPHLRMVFTAGETCPESLVIDWGKGRTFVNLYGPTETTIGTTTIPVEPGEDPPLGDSLPEVETYVLDKYLNLKPVGIPGEIYHGGYFLARGYHKRPALTAQVFVPHPFANRVGERLYKTGDVAFVRTDGQLRFLGRVDFQVKIRGFRIELGEIESQLMSHEKVEAATVMSWIHADGDPRLLAFISLGVTGSKAELLQPIVDPELSESFQAFLATKLPNYMVPATIILLPKFPTILSGKVDRKALAGLIREGVTSQQEYLPPSSPRELRLAQIWSELLHVERIGIHDNFFSLGGHSLLITRLAARIREAFGCHLSVAALFEMPTIAGIVEQLEAAPKGTSLLTYPASTLENNKPYPLSFAQERQWFLDTMEEGITNNMTSVVKLEGQLNPEHVRLAFQRIVNRHAVLRTSFHAGEKGPVQVLEDGFELPFQQIDLRALLPEDRSVRIKEFLEAESARRFDLATAPLIRVSLIRLEENAWILVPTMHHIIADGWSMSLIIGEFTHYYRHIIKGETQDLPLPTHQYVDFARWQRSWLKDEVLQNHLDYWKSQLKGPLPVLRLPVDFPKTEIPDYRGSEVRLVLSQKTSKALQKLAQENDATLFMTLLAAFKLLLHRMTGEQDLIVGAPTSGRTHAGTENLMGCFLNTLALRTQFQSQVDGGSFRDLLEQVRRTTLDAYAHQDLPFEKLVEELQMKRRTDQNPLFNIIFNFINTPEASLELPNLKVSTWEEPEPESKFAMTLYGIEMRDSIGVRLVYRRALFAQPRMEALLQQLGWLLDQIAEAPEKPWAAYSLVLPREQESGFAYQNLIAETDYPTVVEQWLQQAADEPQRVAIRAEDKTMSLGTLAATADDLAAHLIARGLERGAVVAIYGQASFGLVTAICAVLRAGGVILLLDPKLPSARRAKMQAQGQAQCLIHAGPVPEGPLPATIIEMDPQTGLPAIGPERSPLPRLPHGHEPAYLFFTSGSSGEPKGVLGTHKGLAHFLAWERETFEVSKNDVVPLLAGLSFDAVLRDIFLPITSGGVLCIPPEDAKLQADVLLPWFAENGVTLIHTVPSLAASWLADMSGTVALPQLRYLFLAGEPLMQRLVKEWRGQFPGEVINFYGPTETTMIKTWWRLPSVLLPGVQPVGVPQPQTDILVLNKGVLCGKGEPGEVVIRTPYRTLGYLHGIPGGFRPNPWSQDPDDVFYFTGDRGRIRHDGVLEILGRLDRQVKINGIRVEPEEVETLLTNHPEIAEAAVVCRVSPADEPQLLAYLKLEKSLAEPTVLDGDTRQQFRTFLTRYLPEVMIPATMIGLPQMPLMANGKIDRKALPDPPSESTSAKGMLSVPADTLELEILNLWETLLKVYPLQFDDDFFEHGGHSLLAVRMLARVKRTFGQSITIHELFDHSTVRTFAKLLRGHENASPWSPLIPLKTSGKKPPLYMVCPGGGTVFCYKDLARLIDPDRPVYGLQAPGLEEGQRPFLDMKKLATYFNDVIRAFQPEGPYHLLSWSSGGWTAMEMGQQLLAQGHEVPWLIILDTFADFEKYRSFDEVDTLLHLYGRFGVERADLEDLDQEARLQHVLTEAERQGRLDARYERSQFRQLLRFKVDHFLAGKRYDPQPYPGNVLYFKARDQDPNRPLPDATPLWRELSGGDLTVHVVPGDHDSMVEPPCVSQMADLLNKTLNLEPIFKNT